MKKKSTPLKNRTNITLNVMVPCEHHVKESDKKHVLIFDMTNVKRQMFNEFMKKASFYVKDKNKCEMYMEKDGVIYDMSNNVVQYGKIISNYENDLSDDMMRFVDNSIDIIIKELLQELNEK